MLQSGEVQLAQIQTESQLLEPIQVLSKHATLDLIAAASAAFCVCPFMMIVDKSVAENASGKRPLLESLLNSVSELMRKPHTFYRRPELWMIFGVYSTTYFAANFVDSVSTLTRRDQATAKFLSTTGVNMTASIMKDKAYAQMFGTIAPKALPVSSYGCFLVRDSLTIGAAFTLPKKLATEMHEKWGWSYGTCYTIAQLTCPVAAQFLTTPWHLLALDMYNREGVGFGDRVQFLKREMGKSVVARMGRIFPAFGVGGVSNKYFRDSLKEKMLSQQP
eukprot:TRINITY_DN481_c0_g1_i4.p4 TRINITY_DN481_c0_g1~~TRINITY_DN481_c0_g1_i4.p4  ORF type:complete len:276 (-),score=35.56 TRINITY_DN481_c0_g1_i4:2190-3017(-)